MLPKPWRIGKLRGIPIYLNWTVFLWLPWYYLHSKNLTDSFIQFLALLVLIYAHEIGHAFIAISRGVKVHAIKLYLIHGQCKYDTPYYELDDVLIAWGGVLAQFLILILAIIAKYALLATMPAFPQSLAPIFFVFIPLNVIILVINLLPIASLDGHKALRIFSLTWPDFINKRTQKFAQLLNLKRKYRIKKDSERLTEELINQLKNK